MNQDTPNDDTRECRYCGQSFDSMSPTQLGRLRRFPRWALEEARTLERLALAEAVCDRCWQERIETPAQRLIDIGFSLVDEAANGRKSPLLDRLREAQRTMAAQATLASLLTTGTPSATGSQAPSM